MHRVITPILALFFFSFTASANAASFDCGKAKAKVEKLVCADSQLSRLDEELSTAYRDALNVWDGSIAAYVKLTQRGWLASRTLLPIGQDAGGVYCTDDANRLACLRDLYTSRIGVLKSPAFRLGGIYTRGKDFLRILPVRAGLNFGFALSNSDATQGFTDETKPVSVSQGQTSVVFSLVGEGAEACRLDATFTADAVVLVQHGPCSAASLNGRWSRAMDRDPEGELF